MWSGIGSCFEAKTLWFDAQRAFASLDTYRYLASLSLFAVCSGIHVNKVQLHTCHGELAFDAVLRARVCFLLSSTALNGSQTKIRSSAGQEQKTVPQRRDPGLCDGGWATKGPVVATVQEDVEPSHFLEKF